MNKNTTKSPDKRRTARLQALATEDEARKIRNMADARGMTVSTYMVMASLGKVWTAASLLGIGQTPNDGQS